MRPSAKHKQYLTEVCHRHARSIPNPRILCPLSACFASLSSFDTVAVGTGTSLSTSRRLFSVMNAVLTATNSCQDTLGCIDCGFVSVIILLYDSACSTAGTVSFQAGNSWVWRDDGSKSFGEIHFRMIPHFAEKMDPLWCHIGHRYLSRLSDNGLQPGGLPALWVRLDFVVVEGSTWHQF